MLSMSICIHAYVYVNILCSLCFLKFEGILGAIRFRPVESGSNAEQARRSEVLLDSDESMEIVTQPCTSCWVGQGHCESLIRLRISIQHCPDLQHLTQHR